MLVSFDNVSFSYGDNLIFSSASFSINEGEKVALVGANGEGKTTLIKLITGGLTPDSGSVILKNGITIGYLEQNGGLQSEGTVYAEMQKVFAEDMRMVERLSRLSGELADCPPSSREYAVLSAKLDAAQKYVAAHDAYNTDVKIKRVLNGMGFEEFYDRTISGMSGGEKTRLKLARLLLEQPDLLILDEPTNHLDMETLFWLEDYLKGFRGAIFIVSHDRYFLDRTCARTVELENKTLTAYPGNYTKYKALKAERYAFALKEYERQQEERERLQTYIDKNIVRATTAKSAQSRVKQLERMELIQKPYTPPSPPRFSFSGCSGSEPKRGAASGASVSSPSGRRSGRGACFFLRLLRRRSSRGSFCASSPDGAAARSRRGSGAFSFSAVTRKLCISMWKASCTEKSGSSSGSASGTTHSPPEATVSRNSSNCSFGILTSPLPAMRQRRLCVGRSMPATMTLPFGVFILEPGCGKPSHASW